MINRRPPSASERKQGVVSLLPSEQACGRGSVTFAHPLVPLVRALARCCAAELFKRGYSHTELPEPPKDRRQP